MVKAAIFFETHRVAIFLMILATMCHGLQSVWLTHKLTICCLVSKCWAFGYLQPE
jgi:hypothetical protein